MGRGPTVKRPYQAKQKRYTIATYSIPNPIIINTDDPFSRHKINFVSERVIQPAMVAVRILTNIYNISVKGSCVQYIYVCR